MKNKKIVVIFSILLIIILIGGYIIITYVKKKQEENVVIEEYIPEEEINDEQLRQTIVSLYFQNKETKELAPEARMVDIKELINNPYELLFNLLVEGPKNEKYERVIPEGTKVLKCYMEDDCLVLDLSKEILNYNKEDENAKKTLIKSIVNTLTELTEVNKIKILVEGEESAEFSENYIRET